jgi:two-component system response regulator VicR
LTGRARILVVEDDANVRLMVACVLEDEGYLVTVACDGEEAVQRVAIDLPHLIILDLILPKIDGFEVCRRIRSTWSIPILMLTGRATEADKVEGLELGADDYLTKPFGMRELVARVKALLRRAGTGEPLIVPTLTIGDLVVDVRQRSVTVEGRRVHLTPTEFRLLCCLAEHPDEVFASKRLVRLLYNYSPTDREAFDLIRMNVSRLRRKIESNPAVPRYIQTVRGFGYMISQPGAGHDRLPRRTRGTVEPVTLGSRAAG